MEYERLSLIVRLQSNLANMYLSKENSHPAVIVLLGGGGGGGACH